MEQRCNKRDKVHAKPRVMSRITKRRSYIALAVFFGFVFMLLNVLSRESQVTDTAKAISFHQATLTSSQNHALHRDALKLRLRELKMHNALRFVKAEQNAHVSGMTHHSPERIDADPSIQAQIIEQKILQWEANFLHPH
jgi:hypothetical protein